MHRAEREEEDMVRGLFDVEAQVLDDKVDLGALRCSMGSCKTNVIA